MMGLPVDYCVANLKLSSCTQPLQRLSDCALTMVDHCKVSGQGCDAYMADPACAGTIVSSFDEEGPNPAGICPIRVQ